MTGVSAQKSSFHSRAAAATVADVMRLPHLDRVQRILELPVAAFHEIGRPFPAGIWDRAVDAHCRAGQGSAGRGSMRDCLRTSLRVLDEFWSWGAGLASLEGREEAAAAVASLHLERGEPSVAAAVWRRRLAATSPDRLDVAAVIELLGEAEIALNDSDAAIERGHALQ
jgi:hypothetical protein